MSDETSFRAARSTSDSEWGSQHLVRQGNYRQTTFLAEEDCRGWSLTSEFFKDRIECALKYVARPPKRGRAARFVMPRERGEPLGLRRNYAAPICPGQQGSHSGLTPDALSMRPHFSYSARSNAAYSSGVLVTASTSWRA